MRITDAGLIALIGLGDHDAFAELYDRYGVPAHSLALRVTRDPRLAEDVVQEAYLAIWQRPDRFDGTRATLLGWLLTITHHKAVDSVRREQLRRTTQATDIDEPVAATDVPYEAWLVLQRELVELALATLSSREREVIEHCYFDGMSQRELALASGLPLGTVKSRTHSALARLRDCLVRGGLTPDRPWGLEGGPA